jgi:RND family efflux transporter MFP subunit
MSEEIIENLDENEETLEVENVEEPSENVAETLQVEEDKELSPLKRFLLIGGIIAFSLLAIFGYLYYERQKTAEVVAEANAPAEADKKDDVVVSVKVAKAEKSHISQEFTTVGTVAPLEQSSVSASISAQIKQMRLLKNRFVKKGEVLAVLASQDLQAQRNEAVTALEEAKLNLQTLQNVTVPQNKYQLEKDLADAKANADNARATLTRRKDLYDKGGLSLKELESSQLALTNAENALQLVQKNSKLTTSAVNPNAKAVAENKIRQAQERIKSIDTQTTLAKVVAPISGIVTDQFQFDGEFATQGAKLLTIADIGQVIVKAQFADSIAANLHNGDAVTVFPSGLPDEKIGGKISTISHSADAQNRTVEIWANFGNPRGILRMGDAVQFVVDSNPSNDAIVIPLSAVTLEASNGDEGIVMTVDKENVAHETKVKIGTKNNGNVQILEGLEEGDTIVIEGNYGLPDETKVEIAKDETKDDTEK